MARDEIVEAQARWQEADKRATELEHELFSPGNGWGDPDAERAARYQVDCARALAERRYREYADLRRLEDAPSAVESHESAATDSSATATRKCYCNECHRETSHVVHITKSFHSEEEVAPGLVARESVSCSLCSCRGCDSVTMVTETVGDTTNGEEIVVMHPPRTARKRPNWLSRFCLEAYFKSDPKFPFFSEIYDALDIGALRVAMLGIRSLVEHVMLQQVGDQGNFQKNLTAFHSAGHVSQQQRLALQDVIELGNAVTHRAHEPTQDQVQAALDVIESIVRSIYVDPDNIRKAIAQRKPPARGALRRKSK